MAKEESVSLHYCRGSSDKVYFIQLSREGNGYVVNAQYGRRGSTLNDAPKTPQPLPYSKAKRLFDGLVRSKLAKGYEVEGPGPLPRPAPLKVSKKLKAAAEELAKSEIGPGIWF